MTKPDNGMYGIKLIRPEHLDVPCLTDEFDGPSGPFSLMNFSNEGRGPAVARNIPLGHRALVYVIHRQKFVWAIEFTGSVEQGMKAADELAIRPHFITNRWSLFRPIRFVAKVALATAPTAAEIAERTGIRFIANSFTHTYISAEKYRAIYDAVPWDVESDEDLAPAAKASSQAPIALATQVRCLPPIPEAENWIVRIREIRGLPERDMDDLVKRFFICLGHEERRVLFQVGRLDVRLDGADGKPLIVVEVKRSLDSRAAYDDARRKGFDYAGRVGAPWVVLSDADQYEIYDRRVAGDYDAMFCGRFRLTQFQERDIKVLDLLRPRCASISES